VTRQSSNLRIGGCSRGSARRKDAVAALVRDWSDGGPQAVVDCTGERAAIRSGVQLVNSTGRVVVVGISHREVALPVSVFTEKETTSSAARFAPRRTHPRNWRQGGVHGLRRHQGRRRRGTRRAGGRQLRTAGLRGQQCRRGDHKLTADVEEPSTTGSSGSTSRAGTGFSAGRRTPRFA
jgi:hypothetical protein